MPIQRFGNLIDGEFAGEFSLDFATLQPELSALMAEAINLWAMAEQSMGEVFISMLGAKAAPGFAMYASLSGTWARVNTVNAVAESVLNTEDFRLFRATYNLYKCNEKQRHKFAHWLRFYCNQIPGYLILADPKDALESHTEWNERVWRAYDNKSVSPADRFRQLRPLDVDRFECYDAAELKRISERFREIRGCLRQFRMAIEHFASDSSRSESRSILASRPLIAEELRRLDQGSKTPPSEHP